jgi:cytochrome c5
MPPYCKSLNPLCSRYNSIKFLNNHNFLPIMSEEHGNLIKNTKQLSIAVFASFFVPLIIIFLLIVYVSSGKNKVNTASEKSTEALIKPVGKLNFRDASAPREFQTGEAVYKAVCASCHNSGAAGAPKYADASSWGGRISKGYDALYTSVMKGKGAMPARGGASPTDVSDYEIARSVVYLVNSAGGKFAEPKAPPASPAPEPAAAK